MTDLVDDHGRSMDLRDELRHETEPFDALEGYETTAVDNGFNTREPISSCNSRRG